MKLLRRLIMWLRPKIPILNVLLALAAYVANEYFIQGFCQPVPWVWWVLVPSLGAFLVWPLLKDVPRLHYPLLFLQGAFLLVCLYCTLFAGPYLLIPFFFGFLVFPLLLWTPVVFGIQVVRRACHSALPAARWVLGAGMLPLLLAQGWAWSQYQQVTAAVATLPPAQRYQAQPLLRVVPRTYMAERLAGALFKYHNFPEFIFDGWRPPLHDPLVNVCLYVGALTQDVINPLIVQRWQPGSKDYAGYWYGDINPQSAFYHQLFPAEPMKVNCACSYTSDAQHYFAWKPGLTDGFGTPLAEVERNQRETEAFLRAQADSAAADSYSPSPQ